MTKNEECAWIVIREDEKWTRVTMLQLRYDKCLFRYNGVIDECVHTA